MVSLVMAFSPAGIFPISVPEDHIRRCAVRTVHRPGIADHHNSAGIFIPAGGYESPGAAGIDGGIPHRRHHIGTIVGKAELGTVGRVAHGGCDQCAIERQNQFLLHIHTPFKNSRTGRAALIPVYASAPGSVPGTGRRDCCFPGGTRGLANRAAQLPAQTARPPPADRSCARLGDALLCPYCRA